MKIIFSILIILINIWANEFAKSSTCKGCHPIIYSEFHDSSHRKASIFQDPIHKAIWDLHPDKDAKKYTCAKCHTPSDLKLLEKLEKDEYALPKENNIQIQEAISCTYCHSIKNIEEHSKMNKNIVTVKDKVFYSANEENKNLTNKKFTDEISLFGMMKKKSGSPYHAIDYSNENFYTGKMCMGCHSHRQNNNKLDLCRIDNNKIQKEQTNCISCHMPKIKGSATTIKITKTHRYHGFSNTANNINLLDKYIQILFKEEKDFFEIILKNEANHDLFLQPLRVAQLKVNILRKDKTIELDTKSFIRILGKDGQATMPWIANSEIKNTMIKAKEQRNIKYNFKLQGNDQIEVVFGYYKVNPKLIKKLKLENHKEANQFNILKSEFFRSK